MAVLSRENTYRAVFSLLTILFLSGELLFAGVREDVVSLSQQGKVREAIQKYHEYYLQQQKHDAGLLEEILRAFLRNTDPKYGYATRRDASQIIAMEVANGKRDRNKAIEIFRKAMNFPDTGVKVNAAKFLIWLDYSGEDLLPPLKEGLYEGNTAVSLDAALFLGRLKSPAAIPLLEEGMKSPNPLVAVASARALGKIGGNKARALLIDGLKGKITSRGKAGAESMKKIPFSSVIPAHTFRQLKLACARSLGDVGGNDAIETLGEALHSGDKKLKREALNALGKIASREGEKTEQTGWLKKWFKKETSPLSYIKSAMKDKTLREDAARALLELGEKEGIDYFQEKLAKGKLDERLKAASLLAKVGDKSGFKVIGEALQSNQKIRMKAVESLRAFGTDAIPLLEKASGDPHPSVRMKVISVAVGLGEKGEKIVSALTGDSDSDVRERAAFAFTGVELTGSPAMDLLLEGGLFGLKVKRQDVVGLKNKEKIIRTIIQVISSQDKHGKVELATVLLYLGETDTSLPVLRDALAWTSAPRYQKKAAYALAAAKDRSCLPFLEDRFFEFGYAEAETVASLLNGVRS